MSKNRLQLNFQLESAADRNSFVQEYLSTLPFTPNESELETISNYILWGKDSTGKNSQQAGGIKIKEWSTQQVESLEGLLELPGFQETQLRSIQEPATKMPRIVFNRQKALDNAPPHLKDIYLSLFREIDEIELTINYYELFCGRRKNPPRESLLSRFTEEEQTALNEKALRLSQFKYLKLRHLLVELRSEQYSYSDFFSDKIMLHNEGGQVNVDNGNIYIGEDISVAPMGLISDSSLGKKIFNKERNPKPDDFSEEELEEISNLLWQTPTKNQIDFSNEAHVLEIYRLRADLQEAQERDPDQLYGAAGAIVETLKYYEDKAELSSLQKIILEQKLKKIPNATIADNVNREFNKSYNDNYISTIFHQKIIPDVAAAAMHHREIMENIFYPENFKRCKDCGKVLLMIPDNFVKQKKSSDGFSPRCKACEKLKRSKYI